MDKASLVLDLLLCRNFDLVHQKSALSLSNCQEFALNNDLSLVLDLGDFLGQNFVSEVALQGHIRLKPQLKLLGLNYFKPKFLLLLISEILQRLIQEELPII